MLLGVHTGQSGSVIAGSGGERMLTAHHSLHISPSAKALVCLEQPGIPPGCWAFHFRNLSPGSEGGAHPDSPPSMNLVFPLGTSCSCCGLRSPAASPRLCCVPGGCQGPGDATTSARPKSAVGLCGETSPEWQPGSANLGAEPQFRACSWGASPGCGELGWNIAQPACGDCTLGA